MPRQKTVLSANHRAATATELWTDIFHYRITFPDGNGVMFDEEAWRTRGCGLGLVGFVRPGGLESSSYSKIPPRAVTILVLWDSASPEERVAMMLMGYKVEQGEFIQKDVVEADYS